MAYSSNENSTPLLILNGIKIFGLATYSYIHIYAWYSLALLHMSATVKTVEIIKNNKRDIIIKFDP